MPKLVIIEGPGLGSTYKIEEDSITIGRDNANAVQLKDNQVSRCHAQVKKEDGRYVARDLGSKNGIFVNENRVQEKKIDNGDTIRIGSVVMRFITENDPAYSTAVLESGEYEKPTISATVFGDRLDLLQKHRVASPLDLERANRNLIAIYEMSRAASEAQSIDELMKVIVTNLRAVLDSDRVYPILRDERGNGWRPWKLDDSKFDKELSSINVSRSIIDYVIEKRESVLSCQAGSDERFNGSQSIASQGISTALCVPLSTTQKFFGVIYADRLGIAKDFTKDDLEMLTASANQLAPALSNLERIEAVHREKLNLEKELKAEYNIVGQSEAMNNVFEFIKKAAPTDAPVLILGASGTGKELVARGIHYHSARSSGPLEIVNCAAMTEQLVESELFGHMKGSFTGAHEDKPGRFELADGGTIFLDEIGELPEQSQAKILRVLEQGELRRVGGRVDKKVDVRVLAATNRNLDRELKEGKFRQDLFYRLNVLRIKLPLLKDRPGDIVILTKYFLELFCKKCGKELKTLAPDVAHLFETYHWPGNVREMRNIVERMVIMSPTKEISMDEVPYEILHGGTGETPGPMPAVDVCSLGDMERRHIVRVLKFTQGNKSEAANVLGIDRSTLYAKLKTYKIEDM